MNIYKDILRPLLFQFSPEASHGIVVFLLRTFCLIPGVPLLLKKMFVVENPSLEREVAGIKFPNPVGLGAGFDKNALVYKEMGYLGFGFVEVGTVTPLAQPGNAKPRLFRLPDDDGLLNRMGFNNDGVTKIAKRLKKRVGMIHESSQPTIGGNIGKNKDVPNEDAISDYKKCFTSLFDYVDYFVVNVSSPNTPNLRSLQEKEPLTKLLTEIQALNYQMLLLTPNPSLSNREGGNAPKDPPFPGITPSMYAERGQGVSSNKPVFLKIAPDLTNGQLDDIIEIVIQCKVSGIIATNTTLSREGLTTDTTRMGSGGLSGRPLLKRSTEVVKYIHQKSNGAFPIIASGGIHTVHDAMEKFDAGASLIELYTGFIYEGPGLIKRINKELIKRAKQK